MRAGLGAKDSSNADEEISMPTGEGSWMEIRRPFVALLGATLFLSLCSGAVKLPILCLTVRPIF